MKTWKKDNTQSWHRPVMKGTIKKTIIIVQCSNIHSSLFHISNPCQCSHDIIGSLQLSIHIFTVHCFVNPCMCNVLISQPDIRYLADLDMPKFLVKLSCKVHSGCRSSWLV